MKYFLYPWWDNDMHNLAITLRINFVVANSLIKDQLPGD